MRGQGYEHGGEGVASAEQTVGGEEPGGTGQVEGAGGATVDTGEGQLGTAGGTQEQGEEDGQFGAGSGGEEEGPGQQGEHHGAVQTEPEGVAGGLLEEGRGYQVSEVAERVDEGGAGTGEGDECTGHQEAVRGGTGEEAQVREGDHGVEGTDQSVAGIIR